LSLAPVQEHYRDPDAAPTGESINYVPGLDGIRALAVLGVLLYHAGVSWIPAGFLGVDTFFVLSGFLITTLLINEFKKASTIRLIAFWGRRARRLLPALFLVVALTSIFVWLIAARGTYPAYEGDAFGSLFYVANWHFIAEGSNYFAVAGAPSPLTHTWSLAIEEQFYVVWPLVLLALFKLRRGVGSLLGLCIVGAIGSTVWMAYLFSSGAPITRLYYGTDSHSQCLFVGAGIAASLALIARRRREQGTTPSGRSIRTSGGDPGWAAVTNNARLLCGASGMIGVVGGAVLWSRLNSNSPFLYRGGFLLMALFTGGVVVSAVCLQRGIIARCLSIAPMVFIGRISYGLYLWHFPLFQWLNGSRTGLHGITLLGLRLAVSVVAAVLSFYVIERPIRHGGLLRGWQGFVATIVSLVAVGILVVVASHASVSAAQQIQSKIANGHINAAQQQAQVNKAGVIGSLGKPAATGPIVALVFGDSMAQSLGVNLAQSSQAINQQVTILNAGIPGCGIIQSDAYIYFGYQHPRESECLLSPPAGALTVMPYLNYELSTNHPDVVALSAGRIEVSDLIFGTKTMNITQPQVQRIISNDLNKMIKLSAAYGARVVLFTLPCAQPVTDSFGQIALQPNGKPWPENTTVRKNIYNQLLFKAAKMNPETVTVFDTNALVCPGKQFVFTINGNPVRNIDGIHYAPTGTFLGNHIVPVLFTQGTAARDAAYPPSATTTTKPAG
jgi:peptidoglycan/LPS O-acetylase OafA/YrhL